MYACKKDGVEDVAIIDRLTATQLLMRANKCWMCIILPFRLELRCPYSLLRSIAMTACGIAAHTATTTVTSNSGCGANATRTIAGAGLDFGRRLFAIDTPGVRLFSYL